MTMLLLLLLLLLSATTGTATTAAAATEPVVEEAAKATSCLLLLLLLLLLTLLSAQHLEWVESSTATAAAKVELESSTSRRTAREAMEVVCLRLLLAVDRSQHT